MLNVLFRVDGSISLGTGHVVRCITLAQSLSVHGINCSFLCRDYDGQMIGYIESSGFSAYRLNFGRNGEQAPNHVANKVSCARSNAVSKYYTLTGYCDCSYLSIRNVMAKNATRQFAVGRNT